jgi:NAD(P)-dependent dehydrogenase (short-subunit alcohol dehydrogenase family)
MRLVKLRRTISSACSPPNLAVLAFASTGLILDVSSLLCGELMKVFDTAMNPITAEGNMFANLFEKVPAKRAGIPEDIVATILYLVSKAGVCPTCVLF